MMRNRQRKPGIIICCEDTKSCKYYLEAIKKSNVYVTSDNIKKAKKKHKDKEIKECYFVVDTECQNQRPSFESSLSRAREEGFVPIVSNPCYEYWLLLHFEPTRSYFRNYNEVEERLNSHLEQEYHKGNRTQITNYFIPKIDDAIQNAKQIAKQNEEEDEDYPNPSTQLHALVEELINM